MSRKNLKAKEWSYIGMLLKRYENHDDKELKVLRHLKAYSNANKSRLYYKFLDHVGLSNAL